MKPKPIFSERINAFMLDYDFVGYDFESPDRELIFYTRNIEPMSIREFLPDSKIVKYWNELQCLMDYGGQ